MKRISFFIFLSLILVVVSSFYKPLTMKYFAHENQMSFETNDSTLLHQPGERIYLHFDKPIYKPGETIWFRAYLRDETNMRASAQSDLLRVEFIGPHENVLKSYALIASEGGASGDFTLPKTAKGGIYTVKAYTAWQKNEENPFFFEKQIQVQRLVLPRLKMKMDFEKEAYGAGDEAVAEIVLEKLDNTPLKNHDFDYVVSVEGRERRRGKGKTDAQGKAKVTARLPQKIDRPDGLLSVILSYEGQRESISRSIPIVLNRFSLDFFPEGGDLVEGIRTKVAFRILNEFGKPADGAGKILNTNGKTVATFESFHQGMGVFWLQPEAGQTYSAQLTQTAQSEKRWKLPPALPKGYALGITQKNAAPLQLRINAPLSETLTLKARSRGKIYLHKKIKVSPGEHLLEIDTKNFPIGVAQFTLFDAKGIERAERLVFLNRRRKLKVDITPNKTKFAPREAVTLQISVSDEQGIPVPGQFSLAVADDKLIAFADNKDGHIRSKLLLEPDLSGEIYEPNFYFDETEEKSLAALDLLMMTQGWRKFSWKALKKLPPQPQYPAEKAIVAGKVVNRGQAVANATIKIPSDSISVRTNTKGVFRIAGLKLYTPKILEVHTQKGKQQTLTVSHYAQDMLVDLMPLIVFEQDNRMFRNMAMAAAPQEKMLEDALEEDDLNGDEAVGYGAAEALAELDKNDLPENLPLPAVAEIEIGQPAAKAKKKAIEKNQAELEAERNDMAMPEIDEIAEVDIVAGRLAPPEEVEIVYYRAKEFAPPVYPKNEVPQKRTDFRTTVFWKGDLVTDRSGRATVTFPTSDAITAFRATLEGVGNEGSVGRGETTFFNSLPFALDAKIPTATAMGDDLRIPLTLSNQTEKPLEGKLTFTHPESWMPEGNFPKKVNIKAKSSKTLYLPYKVLNKPGEGQFAVRFESKQFKDAFVQEVRTVAKGFPVDLAFSARKNESFSFKIGDVVKGTPEAKLTAYPSVLSDLLKGIESILREPHGCFEQTSSSAYPNLLVKRYLEESGIENPAAAAKADKLIAEGYNKLIAFESKGNGYEWFGGTPAHEALTAYGLMEFEEMGRVYNGVNKAMVKRTADWLLSRRDGKGGFKQDPKALDSFGRADADITNAYIVYSMSEAGYIFEIQKELAQAVKNAENSQDPYQLALVTNALFNAKDKRAEKMLAQLEEHQQKNGSWTGKKHSITYSTGKALRIETTSLALMALLRKAKPDREAVEQASRFIVESRSPYGGFGNPQSTIMALRGLTAYAGFAKQTQEAGTIRIMHKGKVIAEKNYEAGEKEAIVVPGLEKYLTTGKNEFSVSYLDVKNPLPYTLSVSYHSHQPAASDSCKVALTTKLEKTGTTMGETVRLSAQLTNRTEEGLPMTLARIGIPGGLSPQPWQLKELQEKGHIAFYELSAREVIFYFRQMKPKEKKDIYLDLKADFPGSYQGSASSAYLYYTTEHKSWAEAMAVQIKKP